MHNSVRLNRRSSAGTVDFNYLYTSRGKELLARDTKISLLFCQKYLYVLLLLNNSIKKIQILEEHGNAASMRNIIVRRTENKSLYVFISADLTLKPP